MARDFAQWLLTFTDSIANYKYYIDFETIYKNAEEHKIELNMMNSLIGSKIIEDDFEKLVNKYPEVIKCIPILLAVRQYEIIVSSNSSGFCVGCFPCFFSDGLVKEVVQTSFICLLSFNSFINL